LVEVEEVGEFEKSQSLNGLLGGLLGNSLDNFFSFTVSSNLLVDLLVGSLVESSSLFSSLSSLSHGLSVQSLLVGLSDDFFTFTSSGKLVSNSDGLLEEGQLGDLLDQLSVDLFTVSVVGVFTVSVNSSSAQPRRELEEAQDRLDLLEEGSTVVVVDVFTMGVVSMGVFTVVVVTGSSSAQPRGELEEGSSLSDSGFTRDDSSSGGNLSKGESEEGLSDGSVNSFTVSVSSGNSMSVGMAVFTVVVVGNTSVSVGVDLGSNGKTGEGEEGNDGSHI